MLVGAISLGWNFCNFGFHLSGSPKMVRKATHIYLLHCDNVIACWRGFLCLF